MNDWEDIVRQSLADYGASPAVTAAILGDIRQESNFDPRLSGDKGTSWGLLQVGTPMFQKFEAAQTSQGVRPGTPAYVYNQAPFILDKFQQQHPERWDAMQKASNAGDALSIFRSTKDWGYGTEGNRFDYASDYEKQNTAGAAAAQPGVLDQFAGMRDGGVAAPAMAASAPGGPLMSSWSDYGKALTTPTPTESTAKVTSSLLTGIASAIRQSQQNANAQAMSMLQQRPSAIGKLLDQLAANPTMYLQPIKF